MIRCLENRKHCLSPSFFRDRDPRRPLVILPFSDMGTWMREPVDGGETLSPSPRTTCASEPALKLYVGGDAGAMAVGPGDPGSR